MIKIGTIIMNKYNAKDYIKVIGFRGKIKGNLKDIQLIVSLKDNSICYIDYEVIKNMEGVAFNGNNQTM